MVGKSRLGMRNWEFSEQTAREDSVLKSVSGLSAPGSAVSGHQAAFLKMSAYPDRNSVITESNSEVSAIDFTTWVPQRNFLAPPKNITPLQAISPEMTNSPDMPTAPENSLQNGENETKPTKGRKQQSSSKRTSCVATKALRPKESKKQPSMPKKRKRSSGSAEKREKRSLDDIVERAFLDFEGVPVPVCSCTGVPRQCYRWGAGGWQSSCCTTSISEYPLPLSSTKRGARLAGRKMSNGAYGKLLQKLTTEGYDLSNPVDLKNHWARHGTNKFVTIR